MKGKKEGKSQKGHPRPVVRVWKEWQKVTTVFPRSVGFMYRVMGTMIEWQHMADSLEQRETECKRPMRADFKGPSRKGAALTLQVEGAKGERQWASESKEEQDSEEGLISSSNSVKWVPAQVEGTIDYLKNLGEFIAFVSRGSDEIFVVDNLNLSNKHIKPLASSTVFPLHLYISPPYNSWTIC